MQDRRDGTLVPGGGRDLEQLKQEIQRRADRGMPPLVGIAAEEARGALAAIDSLDRDEWARTWSAVGERHWAAGESMQASERQGARDYYWQAWRLFQFARWPTENTSTREHARARALQAFRAYARLLDPPIEVVHIPFEGSAIVGYLRLPAGNRPAPVVFGIAGLDSRKEDVAAQTDAYLRQGLGLFAMDMPGTGESPDAAAATGSQRIFSAVLDYLATRPDVDSRRIVVQGRSWSGYWAARLAFTERERLRGAVMHGGPIHHYFQPDWLKASLTTGEYLYDYLEAECAMHGATDIDDLLAKMRPFSLLKSGLLDRPSAPMLLVNGARDSQIPIADLYLLLEHGDAKDAWVNPLGGHMGRSREWPASAIAEKVLMPWIMRRMNVEETL